MSTPRHALTILAVADLQRAADFYERAFGWARVVDAPVYVEFVLPGDQRLGVYVREGFAVNTMVTPTLPEPGEISGTEIYLYCDDLAASVERATAAGARPLAPAAPREWGDEVAYLADPDGNVLALARPTTSSQKLG